MVKMLKHTFAFSIVAASLSMLLWVCVFWFLISGIVQGGADSAGAQGEISRLVQTRANAKAAAAVMRERRDDILRIQNFFVDRERPIAFLKSLEGIAGALGVTLAVDVDSTEDDKNSLAFRLALGGTREGVMRALALIERMPYGVVVQDASYEEVSSSGTGSTVRSGGTPSSRLTLLIRVRAQGK